MVRLKLSPHERRREILVVLKGTTEGTTAVQCGQENQAQDHPRAHHHDSEIHKQPEPGGEQAGT